MDPMDGCISCIVLAGHLWAIPPEVEGCLDPAVLRKGILEALHTLPHQIARYKDVQGTVTSRLEVGRPVAVESVAEPTGNLVTPGAGYDRSSSEFARNGGGLGTGELQSCNATDS